MTTEVDERMGLPSGSSFHILVNCPGSKNLIASLPKGSEPARPSKMQEVRDRGTLIHEARRLNSIDILESDDDQAAFANGMRMEREIVQDWQDSLPMIQGRKDLVLDSIRETRLWLIDPENLMPVLSAQLDVHYVVEIDSRIYALVVDWKTGFAGYLGSAAENWQLRVSSVLLKNEYDAIQTRVGLIKPDRGESGVYDVADYDPDVLDRWEYAIFYHLWLADQPDAPRRAGDWCFFCPARARCPEAGIMVQTPSYVPPEAVIEADDEDKAVRWAQEMPIEDALALFRKRRLIDQVIDAVSGRIASLSERELAQHGLQRTSGKRLDPISDVGLARTILKRKIALTDEEIDSASSLSKDGLKRLVASVANMSLKGAAAWLDANLDPAITRTRGKPSIIERK